ncbi:hypothetical protein Tcan_09780 [Toxocara canis]|uniref:Uncharacterized protein n=1 Tax=Toxocara canis TaxID=6265 RepID=A0A0B2VVW6_TOXCA|nr:hypothetical protein Tcan_09780 [Toxocara canis]
MEDFRIVSQGCSRHLLPYVIAAGRIVSQGCSRHLLPYVIAAGKVEFLSNAHLSTN